jgi:hypothetical protein
LLKAAHYTTILHYDHRTSELLVKPRDRPHRPLSLGRPLAEQVISDEGLSKVAHFVKTEESAQIRDISLVLVELDGKT